MDNMDRQVMPDIARYIVRRPLVSWWWGDPTARRKRCECLCTYRSVGNPLHSSPNFSSFHDIPRHSTTFHEHHSYKARGAEPRDTIYKTRIRTAESAKHQVELAELWKINHTIAISSAPTNRERPTGWNQIASHWSWCSWIQLKHGLPWSKSSSLANSEGDVLQVPSTAGSAAAETHQSWRLENCRVTNRFLGFGRAV